MRSPVNFLKASRDKMVEPLKTQVQPNSDQGLSGAPEEDISVPQSNLTSSGSLNVAKGSDASANGKEHPPTTNGLQVYGLQTGQEKERITSGEGIKVNEPRKGSETCTCQEEVAMELNGAEDFTIANRAGSTPTQICINEASTAGISDPIILICQKADDFSGSLSSGSDNDSLSAASDSPIFSIDQDLSLWSTLWDPPPDPETLAQLHAHPESLQHSSNDRENSQLKLINRLETWSTGVKKKFKSQIHQLTQKVKPKTQSPDPIKGEDDDRLQEGHTEEDGFSDIPLG